MGHNNAHPTFTVATSTNLAAATSHRRQVGPSARSIGWTGFIAGLVGAGVGVIKILYPASVAESRYSYPFDTVGFTIENLVLAVQHLGLALLVWGVWQSGAAGRTRMVRIGAVGTIAAWVAFAAVKTVATTARDEPLGTALADTVDGLSGLTGVAIGIFSILLGIAVLRAQVWTTGARFVPLAAGLFVFVAVIPSLILGSFTLARVAIITWMALWAVLGWALARSEAGTP